MITIDTESVNLTGPITLIQYSYDFNEEVILYSPWQHTPKEIMGLLEHFADHDGGLLMFNATHDVFKICQLYTVCRLLDPNKCLRNQINEYVEAEIPACDGPCWKPKNICDVFLLARKNQYQTLMDRKDIRIRRIPAALALPLAKELERLVPFKDIYFARRKDKNTPHWQVFPCHDSFGEIDPDWNDICVKFAPSSALKALAADALDIKKDDILLYKDIDVPKQFWAEELLYAPFSKAVGKGAWPEVIERHIDHWLYNSKAREYAANDVRYTRMLWEKFGRPEFGDDDSVLAAAIGAIRWRGFKIDIEGMKKHRAKVIGRRSKCIKCDRISSDCICVCLSCTRKINLIKDQFNDLAGQDYLNNQNKEVTYAECRCKSSNHYPIPTAPRDVKRYVFQELSETEQAILNVANSTKKTVLENIASFTTSCPECLGSKYVSDLTNESIKCPKCDSKGYVSHKAALRAKEVLTARAVAKEIEIYDKLLRAGRFHASFKIIGTLSSRMSGADRLNAQGIKSTKEVRRLFPLAWDNHVLNAGDFSSFEVTLAEACYNDPELRKYLLTCEKCEQEMYFDKVKNNFICKACGSTDARTIHALFGTYLYPPMTYEEVKATKGAAKDLYRDAKSGVFAMFYFAEGYTLNAKLRVNIDIANAAVERFNNTFRVAAKERLKIKNMFASMRQPGGIGTKVQWHEPAEKIETMFGFARYFTLENLICKTLFTLAAKTPAAWKQIKIKVQRRDRMQTAAGAVSSALYGCAFQIQAGIVRAAGNHVIQGSGGQITKKVQRAIWDLQPSGVHEFRVMPMNVHDELQCPSLPEYKEDVRKAVLECVEEIRERVPLIRLDWQSDLKTWADK